MGTCSGNKSLGVLIEVPRLRSSMSPERVGVGTQGTHMVEVLVISSHVTATPFGEAVVCGSLI